MKKVNNVIQQFRMLAKILQQTAIRVWAAPQIFPIVEGIKGRGSHLTWNLPFEKSRRFKKTMLIQQEAEPMPGWHRPPTTNLLLHLYPEVFELAFG
ncbi:MAG: hypothetical protein KGI37_08045 [Alphaproteobacteria bacterium]|nr:hypothetical protein [Alphaproteobacteria bacterium]